MSDPRNTMVTSSGEVTRQLEVLLALLQKQGLVFSNSPGSQHTLTNCKRFG